MTKARTSVVSKLQSEKPDSNQIELSMGEELEEGKVGAL